MRLLISAGEASGEMYGAQLLAALRRRVPSLECFGVGGEGMRVAGCDLVVDAKELSVVGIAEILPRVPKIYAEFRKLVREMDRRRPDAGIVIDSPAFNFKVARELHRRNIPVIYYVCPQLWAWRERRVRLMRAYINKALVIFPFEEQWYRERGVDAEFVGHLLADVEPPSLSREEYAAQHGLDPQKHWVALLPGSRGKEVTMNFPAMAKAAEQLGREYGYVVPVAPTLEWPQALRVDSFAGKLVSDARAALLHARAAVVASGTATVEAAMMGTPMVVVYRVSSLTWAVGRPLVKVQHFAMVNLIAGRLVVPELIQDDFTAENVAAALRQVLADGPAREKMMAELAEVRSRLKIGKEGPAADRAAEAVLKALKCARQCLPRKF
jgi:lipid-A-disaccharide synthase